MSTVAASILGVVLSGVLYALWRLAHLRVCPYTGQPWAKERDGFEDVCSACGNHLMPNYGTIGGTARWEHPNRAERYARLRIPTWVAVVWLPIIFGQGILAAINVAGAVSLPIAFHLVVVDLTLLGLISTLFVVMNVDPGWHIEPCDATPASGYDG